WDDKGRVQCSPTLQVRGTDNVFAAGDCASVPDLASKDPDAVLGPSAQHAVRQARVLADNLLSRLRDEALRVYKHRYAGSVAGLGLYQGAAEGYGIKLKRLRAWLLHRAYHVAQMPTWPLMVRSVGDWLMGLPLRRQLVALGELHHPRAEFVKAANTRGLPTPRDQAE